MALMFHVAGNSLIDGAFFYYLRGSSVLLAVAALFAMPVYPWCVRQIESWKGGMTKMVAGARVALYLALFVLTVAYLVGDTYNPFLYFRF